MLENLCPDCGHPLTVLEERCFEWLPDVTASYAFPIAVSYQKLRQECQQGNPFKALFDAKDCFDVTVRYACILTISTQLRYGPSLDRRHVDQIVAALSRPSTGTWHRLLEDLVSSLPGEIGQILDPIRSWLFDDQKRISKILSDFTHFRNDALGHGASRSDLEYKRLLEIWQRNLNTCLSGAGFAQEWKLVRKTLDADESWMGLPDQDQMARAIAQPTEGEFGVLLHGQFLSLHPYLQFGYCSEDRLPQVFVYDSQKRYDKRKKEVLGLEYQGGHRAGCVDHLALERQWGEDALLAAFRSFQSRIQEIEKDICDFSPIRALHREFIGRDFVFEAIEQFYRDRPSGMFLITGPPGIGKSAIVAKILSDDPTTVHYFFQRTSSSGPLSMVRHCYKQLLLKYAMQDPSDTADLEMLRNKLVNLLNRISEHHLASGDREVIVIDALDEAGGGDQTEAAVAALPKLLPRGIYIVLTSRKGQHLASLRTIDGLGSLELRSASAENIADCAAYLQERLGPRLKAGGAAFQLAKMSEGNFLFLRLLADGIRDQEILLGPTGLPVQEIRRLPDFYEYFWERLVQSLGKDQAALDALYEIALILSAATVPMTVEGILIPLGIPGSVAERVIRHLIQYLEVRSSGDSEVSLVAYRIYHSTFKDFLWKRTRTQHTQVLSKIVEALDDGDGLARQAAVALLSALEAEKPLPSESNGAQAASTGCGTAVGRILKVPSEEDVAALIDFVDHCEIRGWWPREAWVLKQLAETKKRVPEVFDHPESLARMSHRSGLLALNLGQPREALEILQLAAAQAHDLAMRELECEALNAVGDAYVWLDEYEEAFRPLEEAQDLAKQLHDPVLMGSTLCSIADVEYLRGDTDSALEHVAQALSLLESSGNTEEIVNCHDVWGNILSWRGEHSSALPHYQRAEEISRGAGYLWGEITATRNIGEILLDRCELQEAETIFQRSLSLSQSIGDASGEQDSYFDLGRLAAIRGMVEDARAFFGKAHDLARRAEDEDTVIASSVRIALLDLVAGRCREAEPAFIAALRFERSSGDNGAMSVGFLNLADLYLFRGDLTRAERLARRALRLAREAKQLEEIHRAQRSLAAISLERGLAHDASALLVEAARSAEALSMPLHAIHMERLFALRDQEIGELGAAQDRLRKILETCERRGFATEIPQIRVTLAEGHWLQRDYAEARSSAAAAAAEYAALSAAPQAADARTLSAAARAQNADPDRALEEMAALLQALHQSEARVLEARAIGRLGLVQLLCHRREEANRSLRSAIEQLGRLGVGSFWLREFRAGLQ